MAAFGRALLAGLVLLAAALSDAAARSPVRLLAIRYADSATAAGALEQFRKVFLHERPGTSDKSAAASGVCKVEDGWLGFTRDGSDLVLLFQFPDEATVRLAIERAGRMIHTPEAIHDR